MDGERVHRKQTTVDRSKESHQRCFKDKTSMHKDAKNIHPPQMVAPPWLIIQRRALQCAAGAMRGENKNPFTEYGTHMIG